MSKTIRLDKMLGNLGYGTRKELNKYVKNGLVTVNNEIVKDSSMHVKPEEDKINFNGKEVFYRQYIYLLLNKPDGCISATYDRNEKTVLDLLDEKYLAFEPFPIGRLDKDTEGLLLISNDGELSHNLLSPKKHVPKTYFAVIDGKVGESDIAEFKKGVTLDDGYVTLPAELKILKQDNISEIEITIAEGKFHQVKRMFESVNKKVTYLKRISMGALKLDESLKLGEYRELTQEELESLKNR